MLHAKMLLSLRAKTPNEPTGSFLSEPQNPSYFALMLDNVALTLLEGAHNLFVLDKSSNVQGLLL